MKENFTALIIIHRGNGTYLHHVFARRVLLWPLGPSLGQMLELGNLRKLCDPVLLLLVTSLTPIQSPGPRVPLLHVGQQVWKEENIMS